MPRIALQAQGEAIAFVSTGGYVLFKIAALTALASRSDGRATLADLEEQVGALAEIDDAAASELDHFSALADLDLVRSGLVRFDGDTVCITDAGRTVLHALESRSATSTFASMNLIDDLIGAEERLKIFNLEFRSLDADQDVGALTTPENAGAELSGAPVAFPVDAIEVASDAEQTDPEIAGQAGTAEAPAPEAPAFLVSGAQSRAIPITRRQARGFDRLRMLRSKLQQGLRIWRRHLERHEPRSAATPKANLLPAMFALLSVLVLMICAGAAIALMQIKSLKSEIAGMEREMLPLKERLRQLDRSEAQARQKEKDAAETKRASTGREPEQKAIALSREEIQLIGDYIKPAPYAGPPAAPIKVGDPFNGGTIPFPSSLTDKLPKLLGARFAIHNGAIIIIQKGSRNADAVLRVN